MLQLKDTTPFRSSLGSTYGLRGEDTLLLAVKATFSLADKLRVADAQEPVRSTDVYCGEPGRSSLIEAMELSMLKPATDVLVSGFAHSPSAKAVSSLDVVLAVADHVKRLRIFGDRSYTGATIGAWCTPPQPFVTMPLCYERSYGGQLAGEEAMYCPENPVGVGILSSRRANDWKGQRLPNIESPAQLLDGPGRPGVTVGLDAIAPSWQPRRSYIGTYDAAWQRSQAPFLPQDFSALFLQVAPKDQIQSGHLQGGEPIRLENLSAKGVMAFRIPQCEIVGEVDMAGILHKVEFRLATVRVRPDASSFTLTYQASLPCDKQLLRIRQVAIALQKLTLLH